jgi:hypothetical protein
MKHTIFLLLCLVCCLHISCKKDLLEGGKSIEEHANLLGAVDADFFKLRAALAKTVARAFCDEAFRTYFKREFCMLTENHYKELLLSQHLDDVVNSEGTTLKQLLEDNMDKEVKGLFGDELLSRVLEQDPCVVIKLPDLFRVFEWNTEALIPMVVPVTPKPEITFEKPLRFMPYFFNGNHDFIYDAMDYFHCTLKYSEDYFMLDPNTMANEKGISIYEILPQAKDAPDGMLDDMLAIGEESKVYPGKFFINRMQLFKLWQEKYSFKGVFLYQSTACPNQDCVRECIDPVESRMVLDTFQVNLARLFEYQNNKFLDESSTYTFVFWSNLDDQFVRQIYIPALPHEYFEAREISIKLTETNKRKAPTIEYTRTEIEYGKPFVVNGLIRESMHQDEIVHIRSDFQLYSDEVGNWTLDHPLHTIAPKVNSSYSYLEQIDFIEGCYFPLRIFTSQSWFSFNY